MGGFHTTCPDESDTNLSRVSLCFELTDGLGRAQLVSEVREAVSAKTKPSAALRGLAALPFRFMMTTNYDTLFERALAMAGKDAIKRVYDPAGDVPTKNFPDDVEDVDAQRPWLFKMHGDIDDPDSIVISDDDYVRFVHRMASLESYYPIPKSLNFLLGARPVLFVGYRLLDFNLRLLFHTLRRPPDYSVPYSFSVDVQPDPLVSEVWSKQLSMTSSSRTCGRSSRGSTTPSSSRTCPRELVRRADDPALAAGVRRRSADRLTGRFEV